MKNAKRFKVIRTHKGGCWVRTCYKNNKRFALSIIPDNMAEQVKWLFTMQKL
ncbi:MAG: hypothetical protein IJ187_10410 [Neisseriaceae bacterium]|nr:hypothetical protein [Neisseriaceae bacterium]